MKRFGNRLLLTAALTMVLACSGRDPSSLFAPDAGKLVVSSTLIAGHLMPPLFLTETVAPDQPLEDLASVVVKGAEVTISSGALTVTYVEDASGIYWPPLGAPIVLHGTTYRLRILVPDGREVRATTTTPDSLVVDRWVLLDDTGTRVTRTLKPFTDFIDPDSAYTHPDNQLVYTEGLLEAQFRRGSESGYQVGLFALADSLVRANDSDLIEDEDLDRELSSNAIEALDGKIRLPWFAIQWEGPFMTRIYRVDLNWFDYIRSLGLDGFGFGGNAGDNFESPIFHIEGGIGLFGSAAQDSIGFNILPR
jgi:hypothetical protein